MNGLNMLNILVEYLHSCEKIRTERNSCVLARSVQAVGVLHPLPLSPTPLFSFHHAAGELR